MKHRYILLTVLLLTTIIVAYPVHAEPACNVPDDPNPNQSVSYCGLDELKDNGYFEGTPGPAGPTGPTGATGPSGPQGPQGVAGVDGADATTTGLATTTSVENAYATILENDNRLNGGVAAVAAISMIPDAFDGRTAIGVGFTNYRGVEGLAIGVVHKVESLNLKAAISTSSGARDAVIGFGASTSF